MKSKICIFLFMALIVVCHSLFAEVKTYKKTDLGVDFVLDKGLMRVDIVTADVVRVRYTILDAWAEKRSLVVVAPMPDRSDFSVSEEGAKIVIATAKLKIIVNRSTNAIVYEDLSGKILLAEAGSEGKAMRPVTIVGDDTYNCETKFVSPKNEALFGLGCHPLDSLSVDYKGRNQKMLIKYLTGAIPVLLSTRGYGLLWDNYSASDFYGAEAGNTQFRYVSESGNMVDYYFFFGPSFDQIIDSYRDLTGKAPMYPKWSFGLFQSQDRYKSQAEVLSVKDNYRNNHIPVDVVVQDWFWWSPLPIGSHVMNAERYPDPKAMIDELHRDHFHAMISIWPVFGKGTPNYEALQKMGYLTSITWDNFVTKTFDTYYDAHNPKARDLYWEQAKDSVVARYGWDAWWVDQCEPDNGELLDERRKAVFSVGKGIDYFNTYSLEHAKGLYKGWRADIPGKRAFFLIRQAFAGSQGNAATLWSSDVTTTFNALRNQVPQAINACVSGIPYWTSDIGGYISHVDPDGIPDWSRPGNREVFIRWFQFGVFSPIFRIHGKGERALFSKNWDVPTKAILLKYDQLRYRLLPYIYSMAGAVTQKNYTPMRSLAFDFREDSNVYRIPDQYMFGPAFLVNPVTRPLFTGANANHVAKSRNVYLPKKTQWIDFWTGKRLEGGRSVTAAAPLDILPLYVRAGSIVPMGPYLEYATEKPADTIELRIYPGADGKFTIYEDENDGYDYENGQFATIPMGWDDRGHVLTIGKEQGTFPGMEKHHVFNIVIVKENKATGVAPASRYDISADYDGWEARIKVP
jgi:alpha-D-xyloside xylohydrolase